MKKAVVAILAIIGVLSLFAVIIVALIGLVSMSGTKRVPSTVVLEADFERPVIETRPDDPFAEFTMKGVYELREIVDALDRGATDDRVKAFVARIGSGGMGFAQIQEIRDAVQRFRAAGKPTLAYAETFGEFGPGNGGYYLATAFDEIYLQPSGDVGLTGLILENPFVRGTLDKLAIVPRMDQRYEYKNAMNLYTEQAFTPPHRESMQRILDSRFSQLVRGVAEGREMSEQEVRALVDGGPYLGQEALERKLVDGLAYRDEVYATVRERAGSERVELLYVDKYLDRAGSPYARGETIALIHGVGAVTRGRSAYSPIDGSATMGSDTIATAIREAVDDERVKAIVFRVDSPGGSYVGSDTIWRETVRAKEQGKPVIVSMGDLAGSGGYFVAMDADKIVAQPGTITASIGVLAGKLLTREFWAKLGITWDDVQTGEHAEMWTGTHDYDEDEWRRFSAGLDRVYADFTGKVAAGRKLPLERVHEIARGRIWTGEDAKNLGLVDELGGLDVALRLAREAAGLAPDAAIRLKRFPARRSPWQALFEEGPDSSEDTAQVGSTADVIRVLQAQVRTLRRLGAVLEPRGVLSMHEVPVAE